MNRPKQKINTSLSQNISHNDQALLYLNLQLSLEFRCDHNTVSQRNLCHNFWRLIDQHREMDKVMVKGWCDTKYEEDINIKVSSKQPALDLPSEHLRKLLMEHADKLVLGKNCCDAETHILEEVESEDSLNQLREDLKDYDSRVVPLQCIQRKACK